ncbi:hypothetical protein JXB41_05670 [Candidatus Woesearchaeota archaeon]|nr:hypothetical protein [Candidatus Woesearchaeota archaeon]
MNEREIRSKVADGYVHFRAIVEILGKPKEFVAKTLNDYIVNIEKNKALSIVKKDIAKAIKQEEADLYASFVELEILGKDIKELISFCFDYMPSSIEIMDPEQLVYNSNDFTDFLNDIQGRLHTVNMAIQDYKQRNLNLIRNTAAILRNFVLTVLIKPKSIEQINKSTGIKIPEIQKLLTVLEKEGRIVKKGGLYYLKNV